MEFDFYPQWRFIRVNSILPQPSKVVFHTKEQPDLNKITIAIVGVLDNRGHAMVNRSNSIRKELYAMFPGSDVIADLGDIAAGVIQLMTYFCAKKSLLI
jgi:hypothetical protein